MVVRGAAADDLCFVSKFLNAFPHGEISLLLLPLLLAVGIWAFGLRFRPWGWDLDLRTGIWALGLGFGPQGWILCLRLGFRL